MLLIFSDWPEAKEYRDTVLVTCSLIQVPTISSSPGLSSMGAYWICSKLAPLQTMVSQCSYFLSAFCLNKRICRELSFSPLAKTRYSSTPLPSRSAVCTDSWFSPETGAA